MNKIVISLALLVGVVGYAQSTDYTSKVGINNDQPKATLDIKAKTTDGSKLEGILIPRLSRQAAQRMGDAVQKPETSTLIYINDATNGTKATSTIDVDQVGYYYFNDTKWVRLATATVRYTAGVGMQDIGSDNVIKSEFVDKITENGKTGYRVLGTNGGIDDGKYGYIGNKAIDLSISEINSPSKTYSLADNSTPEVLAYGALGNYSFAVGKNVIAAGESSIAAGLGAKATGQDAISFGRYSVASGGQSISFGNGAVATDKYAIAIGKSVTATAQGAVAIGEALTSSNNYSAVLGTHNHVTDTDELFSIGNGAGSTKSNAIVINGSKSGTDIKLGIGLGKEKGTQAIDANGTARLRNIPDVDNTAVNSIVYADADGVLRKGSSFPKMRIVQFSAVADQDWINDFDTKIDATKYDVAILSANLLGAVSDIPDNAIPEPNIYSFKRGNTWRLYADIPYYNTVGKKNGTWFFIVLVATAGSIDYYKTHTVTTPGTSKGLAVPPF